MSYILEALKKADAERERGAVPDLHAQAMPLAAAYAEPPAPPRRAWLWAGGATALLAGALLAGWLGGTGDAPPVSPVAAPAAPVATPTTRPKAAADPDPGQHARTPPPPRADAAPAEPPDDEPAPRPLAPPAPPPAPARATARPAPPGATPSTASPAPVTRAARAAAPPRPAAVPAPRPPVRPAPVAPVAGPGADAAEADEVPATATTPGPAASGPGANAAARVPPLSELPEGVRRQVPPMSIGGSVYSAQPSSRMVIVNGQVLREGSTVAPGLVLERIEPKSAVFSIRGQRFTVPF